MYLHVNEMKIYFASWCCLIGFWMLSVFLALHESKHLRRWFPTLQHTTTSKHLFQGCIHWKKWFQNISCTSLLRCISQSFNHKSLPLRVLEPATSSLQWRSQFYQKRHGFPGKFQCSTEAQWNIAQIISSMHSSINKFATEFHGAAT